MKILRLQAENFKRLTAVSINPDGTMCHITGRNGQGKSSVLDAIQAAFGGAKFAPERPIRKGSSGATIVVETEEIIVRRKWTEKGDSLIVESKDGARFPSPQAMLDRLNSNLSFDPLAFARMPSKQQATMLREITGLDTGKLDLERSNLYAERTKANAEHKRLAAQLQAVRVPEPVPEVGEEVDLSEIHEAKLDLVKTISANADARSESARISLESKRAWETVELLEAQLQKAFDYATATQAKAKAMEDMVAKFIDPDLTDVDTTIAEAKAHNAQVRARQKVADEAAKIKAARDDLMKRVTEALKYSRTLTDRIEAIDEEKAKLLAEAKMPVKGMSIEGDSICINGVPFSQASSAEQIRIGLAMGAALNPKLRVILVRDGSLLDQESLALVGEWAEENNMQVIVERVGNPEGAMGIVIEDGQAVGAPEAVLVEA